jgi:hypothetical protein
MEDLLNDIKLIELIASDIQKMNKLTEAVDNPNLEETYNTELLKLIDNYKAICENVKKQLEGYVLSCRKNNIPIDVGYYRVLKELRRQDYAKLRA